MTRDGTGKECLSFTQLFKNGTIEAVTSYVAREDNGYRWIASLDYEKSIVESVSGYLKCLNLLQATLPIHVFVTLVGIKGALMGVNHSEDRFEQHNKPIEQNVLPAPAAIVQDYEADVTAALKPVFDAFWNASGWKGSLNYDEDGKWNPERRR